MMPVDREVLAAAVLSVYDVSARTTEAVSLTLEQHGLTINTAFVLWFIDPAEPPPSMGVIAERTRCTPPNVTYLCDQLESLGHIARETSATDRRQRIVRLTSAGERARAAVIDSTIAGSPLNGLSDSDLVDLHRMLESIRQNAGLRLA